jgi:hypothetical protein
MLSPASPLAKARSQVERLTLERDRYEADMNATQARLARIQSQQPEASFEARMAEPNGSEPPAAEAIRGLFTEEEMCRKALAHTAAVLAKFNSELAAAMRAVIQCEADEADRIAEQAQQQLDAHVAKLQPLLDEAAHIDGCQFVSRSVSLQIQHDLMIRIPGTALAQPMPIPITRTMQLQMALEQARQKAQFLRNRTVRSHGKAMGYTLAEILSQRRGPLVIGPSDSSIQHAIEQAEQQAWAKYKAAGDDLLAQRERGHTGERTSFTLTWKDGVIQNCAAKVEPTYQTIKVRETEFVTHAPAYGTG